MPRIDDVYPSKWLRASDLEDQVLICTVESITEGVVGQGAEAKNQLIVTFLELEKPLGLNKTNASTIGDVYGPDTDDWIGEKVVIFPTQVDYQGKQVDAIRVNKKKTQEQQQAKFKAAKAATVKPAAVKASAVKATVLAADEPGAADEDIPF